MLKQNKVLRAAVVGTTFMTLFSYLFSLLSKNNTREPELLAKMTGRLFPKLSKSGDRAGGWAAHYAVGLLFAELYSQIWERTAITPTARSGLIFGGLSGLAAILIWKFTLDAHPFPPALDFKTFAVNLLLAHIVFGLFAVFGYNGSSET